MSEERKELFSEKVRAGNRTYYFDVKKSSEGIRYLVISESKVAGAEYEHHRIMIFEENIAEFIRGLDETIAFLGISQKQKSFTVEEIRQLHPKAYTKWSSDEDESLRIKFDEGMSIAKLAQYFQRKPGAIQARLEKLGLK